MKSEDEIEDDIFKVLHNSELSRLVTGAIYSGIKRPPASVKEDITIKCIANGYDNLTGEQTAYVNVNIYIADKTIGKIMQKDRVRIRQVTNLAIFTLHRSGKGLDFRAIVESQNTYEAEGTKQPEHFINIKVKHKSIE